jgi:glycosyltransferase involved in cell wall biosynthesis
MHLTLAVTTHRRPDALAAVLGSVAAQRSPPDELIVADDGSGDETPKVIQSFASTVPYPVRHVWQEHLGFRVARLRNLAIASASGDYIVFIDGDMLLHPEFIADHRRFARPRTFTQGVRIPLDEPATAAVITHGRRTKAAATQSAHAVPADRSGAAARQEHSMRDGALVAASGRRAIYGWHCPPVSFLLRYIANGFIAIKSCNQGFWRSDLVAVNGFDEDFVGWGSEDKDLCVRLRHHGVARQTLLFGGIAFHLHHAPASRARHADNEKLLALTRNERKVRCSRGLDGHSRPVL